MGAVLRFLGTGRGEDVRGTLNEGGFLLETEEGLILVDPGPGAAQALAGAHIKEVNEIVATKPEYGHDANLIKLAKKHVAEITKLSAGITMKLAGACVSYVVDKVLMKDAKKYAGDVLILAGTFDEKLIEKLSPKLAIITGFSQAHLENNPVYLARDIHKKTGVQTIAAH